MSKINKLHALTDEQIGRRIARGKNFWVRSNPERKAALSAANFAGVDIMTRAAKKPLEGFNIYFLNGGSK